MISIFPAKASINSVWNSKKWVIFFDLFSIPKMINNYKKRERLRIYEMMNHSLPLNGMLFYYIHLKAISFVWHTRHALLPHALHTLVSHQDFRCSLKFFRSEKSLFSGRQLLYRANKKMQTQNKDSAENQAALWVCLL